MIKKKIAVMLVLGMAVHTIGNFCPSYATTIEENSEYKVLTSNNTEIVMDEQEKEDTAVSKITEDIVNQYIDIADEVDYYYPAEKTDLLLRTSQLPEKYDARENGKVSSVKNQNPYGTCWAFSVIGAAESQMLTKGQPEMDYSELQLLYFSFHHVDDTLGNLTGDATESKGYLTYGSTNTSSVFALASWIGVGQENIAPYESVVNNVSLELPSELAYDDELHLQNTYMLSMKNSDAVKKLILEYGSVVSGVHMYTTEAYYNEETDALYQNVTKSADHSILIVGWDDNYSVENFATENRPVANGAWLIKNSWGTNKPYIWVSYEDLCLTSQNAYAYDFEDANQYDFNYQYDGSLSTHYEKMENGSTLINVYTADGWDRERIKGVSFATRSDNLSYSIQIYKNSGEENPMDGTPLLDNPVTGTTTFAGYYTVDIDTDVFLEKGDRFSVAITMTDLDDELIQYYADTSGNNSSIVFYNNRTAPGQSYLYENGIIKDLHYEQADTSNGNPTGTGYTARMKVFTTKENIELSDLNDGKFSIAPKHDYTGKKVEPAVTVTYHGKKLTKGTDYTVSYSNNIKIGTATATVEGIGTYTGTKKLSFQIMAKVNPVTVYNGIDYRAVYDYNYYIRKYPSIWRKYRTDDKKTLEYFVKYGMKKGHQAIADFRVQSYACRYYDLRKAYKNNLVKYYLHYIRYGKNEGRKATGTNIMQGGITKLNGVNYKYVFQVGYYADRYDDLFAAYGFDDEQYLRHFVYCGMKEGRQASGNFNVYHYRTRYSDVRKAYGRYLEKYYLHYINFGYKEGRNGK